MSLRTIPMQLSISLMSPSRYRATARLCKSLEHLDFPICIMQLCAYCKATKGGILLGRGYMEQGIIQGRRGK